ncbi:hypothetical protein E4A41_14405, partial [Micrococcus endophyticus]
MSRRVLLLLTAAVLVYALQFLPPLIFHDLVIAPSLGEHFGWALPYLAPSWWSRRWPGRRWRPPPCSGA